jgi:hypothetical protein
MKRLSVFWALCGVLVLALSLAAQNSPPAQGSQPPKPAIDGWTGRPVPSTETDPPVSAPRRDLSGIWDASNGHEPGDGIQARGARNMPDDRRPEHQLPYTPEGLAAWQRNQPSDGTRAAGLDAIDDPALTCEPQGMPRQNLYELRTTQIVQTAQKVVVLYEYDKTWRVIWMDGRELPKNPEPQWYGYSSGRWVDDYTFVAETIGADERTWVDNVGRPHSDEMRIEETFHRVSRDRMELTVTLTDPKYYTKPWVALDRFSLRRLPDDYHVREMLCSPSEYQKYLKMFVGK